MGSQIHDWAWRDAGDVVDAAELARVTGMSGAELAELLEYGALVPIAGGGPLRFGASCVGPLREAARLREDYDLDLFTTALLLGYLMRIEQLERRPRTLGHAPGTAPNRSRLEGPAPWLEPHA